MWKTRFYQLLPLVVALMIWELLSIQSSQFVFKYSSPINIAHTFYSQLTDSNLISKYNIYLSFLLTFSETIAGFILGNIFGSFLGLLLWYSKRTARITKPYLIAIGSVPIFALAPLLILWFGTGFEAKVIMSAFSVFLVATIQSYEGAQNVDLDYVYLFKSLGATRVQILWKLIIPSSLIWVFTSYKLNIGFAIIGAFIGEWISSEYGIGHMILAAGGLYDVSLIFVGIICLMLISLFLNYIIGLCEKKIFKWRNHLVQNK